jgi:hypothetical protein
MYNGREKPRSKYGYGKSTEPRSNMAIKIQKSQDPNMAM